MADGGSKGAISPSASDPFPAKAVCTVIICACMQGSPLSIPEVRYAHQLLRCTVAQPLFEVCTCGVDLHSNWLRLQSRGSSMRSVADWLPPACILQHVVVAVLEGFGSTSDTLMDPSTIPFQTSGPRELCRIQSQCCLCLRRQERLSRSLILLSSVSVESWPS